MAVLKNKRTLPAPMGNACEYVRIKYDFARDTGAIADYDVFEADSPMIVKLHSAVVKTAVTSGGATNIDLGAEAGGTEFWSNKLKGALTLNSINQSDTRETAVYLADGGKIVMGIEAQTVTAGVIEFVFQIFKY